MTTGRINQVATLGGGPSREGTPGRLPRPGPPAKGEGRQMHQWTPPRDREASSTAVGV